MNTFPGPLIFLYEFDAFPLRIVFFKYLCVCGCVTSFVLEVTWCCFLLSGLVTGEACGQHQSVDGCGSVLPHGFFPRSRPPAALAPVSTPFWLSTIGKGFYPLHSLLYCSLELEDKRLMVITLWLALLGYILKEN